jgi:hypothetical protein
MAATVLLKIFVAIYCNGILLQKEMIIIIIEKP